MDKTEILQAVSRGWATDRNSKKVMDTELAEDISEEIYQLYNTDIEPKLGCATTRQLIEEICARLNLDLNYKTIDSD